MVLAFSLWGIEFDTLGPQTANYESNIAWKQEKNIFIYFDCLFLFLFLSLSLFLLSVYMYMLYSFLFSAFLFFLFSINSWKH